VLALPLQHSLTESVAISRITSAAIATRNNIEEKRTSINKSIQIQGEVQNKYTKCPRTPTDKCHGAGVFFVWESTQSFGNFATADFHQIWSRNVIRCPVDESGDILENFYFMGHLPPKSEIKSWSNRHLTQSRLQVTGCTAERYCLFHVVVQGPPQRFPTPVKFSVEHTVAELWGIKVAQFSEFGLFSPYKTPKMYLPVTSLQPRGYIAE